MWIPTPSGANARDAYEQVLMLERYGALHSYDKLEQRINLLINLFDCCEPETYDALVHQKNIVSKFYRHPRY